MVGCDLEPQTTVACGSSIVQYVVPCLLPATVYVAISTGGGRETNSLCSSCSGRCAAISHCECHHLDLSAGRRETVTIPPSLPPPTLTSPVSGKRKWWMW